MDLLASGGGGGGGHWILSASLREGERTIGSASLRGEERGPLDLFCQPQGIIEDKWICQPQGRGKMTIGSFLPASGKGR